MVTTAPNQTLEARYQEGLVEFDRALEVVREYLVAMGLGDHLGEIETIARPDQDAGVSVDDELVSRRVGLPFVAQPEPEAQPELVEENLPGRRGGKGVWILALLMLLLGLAGLGGWMYLKLERQRDLVKQQRVAFLERQGAIFIENRRWPDAEEAYAQMELIYPESDLVTKGRSSIQAGIEEEQNQFIGYWKGEAIAAFEASRWNDAERAARKVLEKFPGEEELTALTGRIAMAKERELREEAFAGVRTRIADREFDKALSDAQALVAEDAGDAEAAELLKEARAAKEKAEANLLRARGLAAMAAGKDTGEYDEEAIGWMREALVLAPDDAAIMARYEKMASYTRTVRVPEDVETLGEALASAREKDRIVIAEGTFEGPFEIAIGVELEGVSGKTILQCAADSGSVLAFHPGVKGARASGLTVRHLSFDAGAERFSLAHVRGAGVEFSDCRFEQGSGHGIAVTEGGHAMVKRCRFTENGWDGIAVNGSASLLEADQNVLKGNFQNGIEGWDGAAVILSNNECTGNSRNGIHIDCGQASATVLGNTLSGNREYGLVATSAGSGQITGNTMDTNILGGMVVRSAAAKLQVKGNTISSNKGPGLVLEKGISEGAYQDNRISGNEVKQLVTGIDFSEGD